MRANDRLIEARRRALWREVAKTRRGRDWHGHRWDQVVYSAAIVFAMAALVVLGMIAGAAYAMFCR